MERRRQEVDELFNAALHCPPAQLQALLNRSDSDIRLEVERMLAAGLASVLHPGMRLGRYEIEAVLGAGGMGRVFRARDTQLGRPVAIKASSGTFQARFQIEARAISALNHPHICTLYDVGPNYLVMELVEGQTLADRLKPGPLPHNHALGFAIQIAAALEEAHSHGIVHRDLKPANIMLTRHGVKVLDFGLARLLDETSVTEARMVLGTPAYMAPEQVEGGEPTPAADLFSLGVVLYEMVTGALPVPGASLGRMLASGAAPAIVPITRQRRHLLPELDRLFQSLVEKDPARRPPSAHAAESRLTAMLPREATAPRRARRWFAIGGAVAFVLALLTGSLLFRRMQRIRWVREQAMPAIAQLAPAQPLAAFRLLREADAILPGDPQLARRQAASTQLIAVTSDPPGATVEIQDYLNPGAWFTLGTTPLRRVRVPRGYFRWRVSKPGLGSFISAPITSPAMRFPIDAVHRLAASGMVPVSGGSWEELIDFLGWVRAKNLPNYDMDKFEVTNAQYQRFVDQGGYRNPRFWRHKFVLEGKTLSWTQAISRFRDRTGRPGPASWEAGHYPLGQADFPVSGVSWYEAAAYAAFAGQSLPVLAQFYRAAPDDLAYFAANAGNFGGSGTVAVGARNSVGPFGTYDMAGNVREWSRSAVGADRFILGGAVGTQTYQAFDPEALPPFDRSPMNGFRTVRNHAPLPLDALAPLVRQRRSFSHVAPASDAVFQAYKAMYAYEPVPLRPRAGAARNAPDWTVQKVTIDAGHDGERLPMYLFLPKHVQPPYQSVVFFPSARVELLRDSRHLGDMQFVDYIIKNGRALLYPIYLDTYERHVDPLQLVGSVGDLQLTMKWSKEVRRAVDYLDTRKDMDASKIAYLGVSMGAAYGVIFTALEPRFRAVVFLDGGFFLASPPKGRDQVDFAPRVTKPVLMVNGKYDFTFSPDRAQAPMFRALGTDPADKKRVVLDTPHDVSQQRAELSRVVLAWLDRYLGAVRY